jgi:hypothetical protein
MALVQTQVEARKGSSAKTPAGPQLRGNAASLAAASVLMLTFMGATLPTPLYVIYRDELHFSQITLTLIYAVYLAVRSPPPSFSGGCLTRPAGAWRYSPRSRSA